MEEEPQPEDNATDLSSELRAEIQQLRAEMEMLEKRLDEKELSDTQGLTQQLFERKQFDSRVQEVEDQIEETAKQLHGMSFSSSNPKFHIHGRFPYYAVSLRDKPGVGEGGAEPEVPILGFQLATLGDAGIVNEEAGVTNFVVVPSIIDADFHPLGAEKVPTYNGISLESYPLFAATTTTRGVYFRVEITYNEYYEAEIVGDWTVVVAEEKPDETLLYRSSGGSTTNGVYYRRVGTCQWTEGTGLVLKQDRFGPWHVQMCVGSQHIIVSSPWWALSYVQEVTEPE